MEDLKVFFDKNFENQINRKMLYFDYQYPTCDVMEYIDNLLSISIDNYLDFIYYYEPVTTITASDVFQFSRLEDCSINLCSKIIKIDNPGITCIEAGKLLRTDGIIRKPGADTKYGENHLKAGTLLGLLFELTNTYFLTCLGYIFPSLTEDKQLELLSRLILRTNLISRMIKASNNGTVNVRQFLYMLSDSTYNRRKSNIKTILAVLLTSNRDVFSDLMNRFVF